MLRYLISSILLFSWSACSFEHIAEVRMQNNNAEPVQIILQANNITFTSDTIAAFAKSVKPWNWTALQKGTEQIHITVHYTTSKQTEVFDALQFSNGTLSNYIDITVQKGNLQCKLSD